MIDRTEVTNTAFATFVRQTGYVTLAERDGDPRSWRTFATPDRASHPATYIACENAVAYCQYAGKRLPTEIEWEKAARGDDARMWPWGNDWNETRVNSMDRGQTGTTPAGAFPDGASPYGALDMAGNVWEWIASAYGATISHDPSGNAVATEMFRGHRVLCSGSWRTMASGTQVVCRNPAPPEYRRDSSGFRCAA